MQIFQTISDKNYGKKRYLDNFVFLSPSPSWQCWRTISKSCVKQCYRFATLYRRREGILNLLFKIVIIFCHWLSKIYETKKKESTGLMHALRDNSNLFDESNYVSQHSDMSIITENCAKISHQLPECWGTTSKSYVKQCYRFATLYRGRGVNFKLTFKNSRNILLLIVWNLQKKEKRKQPFDACCCK